MYYKLENQYITLQVTEENDLLTIQGKVKNPENYEEMLLVAASPIDRMMNYSGSGLAFPNSFIAFEGTPNFLKIGATGMVQTIFKKPNSYYADDTRTRVEPSLFVKLHTQNVQEPIVVRFALEETLPLKTVFYRPQRTGPDFYQKKADIIGVQAQDKIIQIIKDVKINHGCA